MTVNVAFESEELMAWSLLEPVAEVCGVSQGCADGMKPVASRSESLRCLDGKRDGCCEVEEPHGRYPCS